MTAELRLSCLDGPVRLTRCAAGIVLVRADCLPDAMAGLGYATACDRSFQLDMFRRQAVGTAAELVGPAAVPADLRQRRLHLAPVAERAVAALPARHRILLDRYAAGINLARAEQPPPWEHRLLGVRTQPWRPVDSMLVALYLAQLLCGDGRETLTEWVMRDHLPAEVADFLLGDADPYRVDTAGLPLPGDERKMPISAIRKLIAEARGRGLPERAVVADDEPWGSNAWAVAAGRTEDGRAILASDMHLPLTAPSLCHRSALAWGVDRVDGVTVPGVPVFVAASTERLAWGPTRLAARTVTPVEVPDGTRTRTERIVVRDGDPIDVELHDSQDGPVFGSTADGGPVARRWTCAQPGGIDLGLVDLLSAGDVWTACEIAGAARGAPLNLLFADRDGHIGWTTSGQEDAQRPVLIDPPVGVIVNANNRMPGHADGPHFGGRRAARIGALLAEHPQWTERGLLAVQADVDAEFYGFYRDLALAVLDDDVVAGRPDRTALRTGLLCWDGTARTDAVGLPALVVFRELARETWFGCLLGGCLAADPSFAYRWHNHEAPLRALLAHPELAPVPYRDRTAFLLGELDLTVRILARLAPGTAPDAVTWAMCNAAAIRHPLSSAFPDLAGRWDLSWQPLAGCAETVNACRPGFGPVFRLVAAPGHLAGALANLPGGQSGDPDDPTYRDQFPDWLAARPALLRTERTADAEVTWLHPATT